MFEKIEMIATCENVVCDPFLKYIEPDLMGGKLNWLKFRDHHGMSNSMVRGDFLMNYTMKMCMMCRQMTAE